MACNGYWLQLYVAVEFGPLLLSMHSILTTSEWSNGRNDPSHFVGKKTSLKDDNLFTVIRANKLMDSDQLSFSSVTMTFHNDCNFIYTQRELWCGIFFQLKSIVWFSWGLIRCYFIWWVHHNSVCSLIL